MAVNHVVRGSNPLVGVYIMKRVIIVHGWSGSPKEELFVWLKKELEKRGFFVECPAMPDADNPIIKEWVEYLSKIVGKPNENTILVGHSIGCQTIMHYLETLDSPGKVGGVVFIAGWIGLKGLESEEEKAIAKPWLENKIDFNKVKKVGSKFVAIFSDDDPFVQISDSELFKKKLGAKVLVEHNKGHFTASDGVVSLESALKSVLELASA